MKKSLLVVLLFTLFSSFGQKGDQVFRDDTVHTLRINFYGDIDSTNDGVWNDTLFASYQERLFGNREEHEYFPAEVIFDDQTIKDSVGIRMKGLASTQKMRGKEAFKLDFNEYDENGDLNGLTKLNLQNEYGDATFLANKISYDMAHWLGINAPRASFVKVYMNGAYYGLYTMVEEVDPQFLKMHYSEEGDLFKPPYFQWNEEDSLYLPSSVVDRSLWYEDVINADNNDDAPDYSRMLETYRFIQANMDNDFLGDSLGNYFDLEQYLKHFAMDIALMAFDNSFLGGNANIYYRVDPVTNKIQTIPWDYNLSFQLHFLYNRGEDLRRRISVDSTTQWGLSLIHI